MEMAITQSQEEWRGGKGGTHAELVNFIAHRFYTDALLLVIRRAVYRVADRVGPKNVAFEGHSGLRIMCSRDDQFISPTLPGPQLHNRGHRESYRRVCQPSPMRRVDTNVLLPHTISLVSGGLENR